MTNKFIEEILPGLILIIFPVALFVGIFWRIHWENTQKENRLIKIENRLKTLEQKK